MWVIWFALFTGLFIIAHFAAPKPTEAAKGVEQVYSMFTFIGVGLCAAALLIRVLIIPRLNSPEKLLQAMIIGLALCDGAAMLGMFVVPTDQIVERKLLFSVAVGCMALSAPIYAKGQLSDKKPSSII